MPAPFSPARASIWEWIQTALLAANLAWTTLCLGGFLAETMVVTVALNGLLLVVHFAARAAGAVGRSHPAGKWLLPFLAYAAINVLRVTPVRWLGWQDWLEWAQIIAVFWVVLNGVRAPATRAALLVVLMGLGVSGVVMECYQRFVRPDWMMLGRTQAEQFIHRSSGPFGIPNSMAALLLLLLPVTLALVLRRGASALQRLIFGYLTLVFALGLVLTVSRGAWLGLTLALAAWPLFAIRRHWLWRLSGTVIIIVVMLAAVAALRSALPTVRERLDALVRDSGENARPIIWRGAWGIFRDHPVFGGGAASFDVLFEKYRPEHFLDQPRWAHNDYLNTLCDYGVTGFVLSFGCCGLIACVCLRGKGTDEHSRRRSFDHPLVTQGLTVGMAAFGFHLFFEFHLKMPALAMSLAAIAAVIVQRRWPLSVESAAPTRLNQFISAVVMVAVCVTTLGVAMPHYRSEALRYAMRREIDRLPRHTIAPEVERALLLRAREGFDHAVDLDPTNAQAWADRAYATTLWSHHERPRLMELGREAEGYARRALGLSTMVPEFWLRLGVSLDMQGRWLEAGDAFITALNLAPADTLTWYHQAYHLASDPRYIGLAKAAVAISLRLDPGNAESEALRQRLANSR